MPEWPAPLYCGAAQLPRLWLFHRRQEFPYESTLSTGLLASLRPVKREEIPGCVADLLGKPVRWCSGEHCIPVWDGVERTLEVFNASPREQLSLLKKMGSIRAEAETSAGGPLVVIFHTPEQTHRLYPEFSSAALES